MISKEEYTLFNLREHCIKTMQFSNRNSNAYKEHELVLATMNENISLKYRLEQLETNNEKLIKKLEQNISQLNTIKNMNQLSPKGEGALELAQEILEITKGETR